MKRISSFIAGLLVGAMLFGGGAVYAASGVLAERSAQAVYVDGRRVDLEAYLIDGANYVKLRDIGQAVDFNVFWDGAVQIESGAPYTGEAPASVMHQDSVDYSAAVDPAVFTSVYTREAYNAAYEVLAGVRAGDLSRTGTVHFVSTSDRQKYENLIGELANGITLSVRWISDETYEVYAHKMDWSAADTATEEVIQEARKLPTDREKVVYLNEWLCEHLIYNPKAFASVIKIATSDEAVEGSCASFACAMNYLCGRLGIPCVQVSGESHGWNSIFVDGVWSYTDASLNDQVSDDEAMLFAPTARKQISDSAGLRFLQELLVPGSTA